MEATGVIGGGPGSGRRSSLPTPEERKLLKHQRHQQLQKAASEPGVRANGDELLENFVQTTPNPPNYARGQGGSSPVPRPVTLVRRTPKNRVLDFDDSNAYADENTPGPESLSPASGLSVLGGMCEVGLDNLGNTCFMNSILQCLTHIRPLAQFFLLNKITALKEQINAKSPTRGVLALSFAYLCRELSQTAQKSGVHSSTSITPTNFKKAVGAYAPHLLDYQQQDSHEFLRFLLNGMSEDLCRAQPAGGAAGAGAGSEKEASSTNSPMRQTQRRGESERADGGEEDSADPAAQTASGDAATTPARAACAPHTSPSSKKMSLPEKLRSDIEHANSSNSAGEGDLNAALEHVNLGAAVAPQAAPAGAGDGAAEAAGEEEGGGDGSGVTVTEPPAGAGAAPAPAIKSPAEAAEEAWRGYLKLNDSVVTDIFGGQLQSCIECQECKYVSRTYDPFLDISVEIPRSDSKTLLQKTLAFTDSAKTSLEACLKKFTGGELLEGENMWKCDECKEPRKAMKKLAIYKLPKVLVISFKRFRGGSGARGDSSKVNSDVTFPIDEGLDLAPYAAKDSKLVPQNPVYDLIGVSNHSGGMGGGHYTAHCEVSNNAAASVRGAPSHVAQWMCFNDSKVSKAKTSSAIAGPSAYLLFYQLRESERAEQ